MAINLSAYKNIAIINFHHIGDTVCNFSLFKYCRLQAPQAKITVFLGKENGVLAPWIDGCDEVIIVPITSKERRYCSIIKFALKYRKKFDLVICGLEPRKYIHIFMGILGAETSIAYIENTWHSKLINSGVLYDDPLQRTRHNALQMLNVVANYEELPDELRPRITIPPAIKQQFLPQILAQLGDKIFAPRLLISVTNNRPSCTIDFDRYCFLFNELKKTFNFSVIISSLQRDMARAQQLAALLPVPAVPVMTPDFSEFLTLLDWVDGCFLGDGGIVHLAAALDKPQLVLLGKVSPIEWWPLSKKTQCLSHPENVNQLDKKIIMIELSNLLKQVS